MKESEWKETVDAITKSTYSNLTYEFAFISYSIRRWTGDIQQICMRSPANFKSKKRMLILNVYTKISTTCDLPVALSLGLM